MFYKFLVSFKHYYCMLLKLKLAIFCKKIRVLKNVEKITGIIFGGYCTQYVYNILDSCKEKLKWIFCCIIPLFLKENTLPPLTLANAQYVKISSPIGFYIKWSNKCKQLELGHYIFWECFSNHWCQYVVDNVCLFV